MVGLLSQPGFGGWLQRPMGFLGNNSNFLLSLGAGLLDRGENVDANPLGQVVKNAMVGKALDQNRTETARKRTATVDFILKRGLAGTPEEAQQMVDAGFADTILKSSLEPKDPSDPFKVVGGAIYDTASGQWITPPEGAGSDEYGLSPVYGQDAQGNPVIMQLSKGGGARPVQLPQGVTATPGVDRIDLGTHWGITNRAGDVVSTIPKNIAGEARDRAAGGVEGAQIGAAPTNISNADIALQAIQELKTHPGKSRGTGASSVFNVIPGTIGKDFQARVDQVTGGAFLTAIQQMQGLGQLSNAEGQTATAAISRMNTATSEKEFDDALADYEAIVQRGKRRAESKLGIEKPEPAADDGWVTMPDGTMVREVR